MLACKIDVKNLSNKDLLCDDCDICKGKSKFNYPFSRDLKNSDDFVKALISYITSKTGLECEYTEIDKNPDINVLGDKGNVVCRIEAKYLEGQAFMKSKQFVGLYPKETLVVDEPKLLSYLECKCKDKESGRNIPIYIVWKFDRPCSDVGGIAVFQEISELDRIRCSCGRARAFERKAARTDFTHGQKMGITKKYHFSITECLPIEDLPDKIKESI